MNLAWENLTVELPIKRKLSKSIGSRKKKLLDNLCGFAEPGRIMAVMGPSGSGKSTFLDCLAGRLSANLEMSGKILINGKCKSKDSNEISYVTQEDFFLGTLTVRETITYSAHLRLPTKLTKQDIHTIVESTIAEMGLQDCAETVIGNWHMRGISSGEKKRLSIGVEILTHPHVLFLDEPTTGLDSAAAFFVVQALRNIAFDDRVVVCSIHQPSSDVFQLFDDLLLLSTGETVYFGDSRLAIKFFGESGFPCPTRRNPSDHFLRCISLDFDNITEALLRNSKNFEFISESSAYHMKTATIRSTLVEKYKNSECSTFTQSRIKEIEANGDREFVTRRRRKKGIRTSLNGGSGGWRKQWWTLTRRSFVNMYRDVGYYWLRSLFYISISIIIGTLFFHAGNDNASILLRAKCVVFAFGFMICLSSGGLPFFFDELKVLRRERLGGYYGELAYVMSNYMSSLPFLSMMSVVSGTIIYYMVKFHPGYPHYAFFCIDLFCCISIIESFMILVASLVPNALIGIGVGTSMIVFMMMASEISRPLFDLPKFFWRYPMSYISFSAWAIEGQFKNDMIGLEFDPLVPGQPKVKGEILLQTLFGVSIGHSKWYDIIALLVSLFAYRLLLYLVLKYKLSVSSIFSTILQLYPNRNPKTSRRFSLPLSSQEGFKSPLP